MSVASQWKLKEKEAAAAAAASGAAVSKTGIFGARGKIEASAKEAHGGGGVGGEGVGGGGGVGGGRGGRGGRGEGGGGGEIGQLGFKAQTEKLCTLETSKPIPPQATPFAKQGQSKLPVGKDTLKSFQTRETYVTHTKDGTAQSVDGVPPTSKIPVGAKETTASVGGRKFSGTGPKKDELPSTIRSKAEDSKHKATELKREPAGGAKNSDATAAAAAASGDDGPFGLGRTKDLAGFWANQNDEVKSVKKKRLTAVEENLTPMVVENNPQQLEGVVRAQDPGEWKKPLQVEDGWTKNVVCSLQKRQQESFTRRAPISLVEDTPNENSDAAQDTGSAKVKVKDISQRLVSQQSEPDKKPKEKLVIDRSQGAIVLAENQPMEVDPDVVRSDDPSTEEVILEKGRTRNLLQLWKNTEVEYNTPKTSTSRYQGSKPAWILEIEAAKGNSIDKNEDDGESEENKTTEAYDDSGKSDTHWPERDSEIEITAHAESQQNINLDNNACVPLPKEMKNVDIPLSKEMKNVDIPLPMEMDKNVEITVPKEMDKNVEILVPKEMDKNVEIPVPKEMDKNVEIPVPKEMDKNVEIPVPKKMDKNVDIPVPKEMDKNVEIPVPKKMDKNVDTFLHKECASVETVKALKPKTDADETSNGGENGGTIIKDISCGEIPTTASLDIRSQVQLTGALPDLVTNEVEIAEKPLMSELAEEKLTEEIRVGQCPEELAPLVGAKLKDEVCEQVNRNEPIQSRLDEETEVPKVIPEERKSNSEVFNDIISSSLDQNIALQEGIEGEKEVHKLSLEEITPTAEASENITQNESALKKQVLLPESSNVSLDQQEPEEKVNEEVHQAPSTEIKPKQAKDDVALSLTQAENGGIELNKTEREVALNRNDADISEAGDVEPIQRHVASTEGPHDIVLDSPSKPTDDSVSKVSPIQTVLPLPQSFLDYSGTPEEAPRKVPNEAMKIQPETNSVFEGNKVAATSDSHETLSDQEIFSTPTTTPVILDTPFDSSIKTKQTESCDSEPKESKEKNKGEDSHESSFIEGSLIDLQAKSPETKQDNLTLFSLDDLLRLEPSSNLEHTAADNTPCLVPVSSPSTPEASANSQRSSGFFDSDAEKDRVWFNTREEQTATIAKTETISTEHQSAYTAESLERKTGDANTTGKKAEPDKKADASQRYCRIM